MQPPRDEHCTCIINTLPKFVEKIVGGSLD